ncbi:MAG: DUF4249 domain-containing protein [Bacteroidales bacterium]|nr:DUF4249 domain-containing protein [Bacteroidales bacterium]
MDGIFKIFFFCILTLSVVACEIQEKKINRQLPFEGERLVVYGIITTNKGVEVTVLKSLPLNCFSCPNTVNNAKVYLYENNELLTELISSDGINFYTSDEIKPSTQNSYYIEVTAPNLPKARSSTIQPIESPTIDTAYIKFENHLTILSFSFFKPYSKTRYYNYAIEALKKNGQKVDIRKKYFHYHSTMQINEMGNIFRETKFYIEKNNISNIKFFLFQIDEQIFKFLKSQYDFESTYDEPYSDMPFPIYSNISGGYGIFGSVGADSILLEIK